MFDSFSKTLTGNLLQILERHYQPISCIAIASDSSYFVTGGEDGLALVWSLSRVISNNDMTITDSNMSAKEPTHKWSHNTNSITDIHIGLGGIRAHCLICSTDQTCRVGAHLDSCLSQESLVFKLKIVYKLIICFRFTNCFLDI